MVVDGTNLSMIRGDSEYIVVQVENADGSIFTPETGDTLYMTVKRSTTSDNKVFQKVLTEVDYDAEPEAFVIEISPSDTADLVYATYVYDIQLVYTRDGKENVSTIVKPSSFTIEGEVTFDA